MIPRLEDARLVLWTIYFPADRFSNYVANLSIVGTDSLTPHRIAATDLDDLRSRLLAYGLHRIERAPDDDRTIIEVWL